MWGISARRARLRQRASGPRLRHRALPRERAQRGEPGQGLRAALRAGRPAAARAPPPPRRAALDRRRAVPGPHPLEPDARQRRLRPIAEELARELSEMPDTTQGQRDRRPAASGAGRARSRPLAGTGVTWAALTGALQAGSARASTRAPPCAATARCASRRVRSSGAPRTSAGVVVGVRAGRPVYVRDVARVIDGPDEATTCRVLRARRGRRHRRRGPPASEYPAVTIALAKRPGANATPSRSSRWPRSSALRPRLLPADVHVDVTRNYGETAREKSNELVEHLLIATLSVVVLVSLAMGWRSGLVVGIAVPVTLALTLFIYFLAGYTLNRVTLFALIFSIGILVDDAIVVVENIERHHREKPGQPLARTSRCEAVDEVGNPTILATFTVIAAILPMAFVRGPDRARTCARSPPGPPPRCCSRSPSLSWSRPGRPTGSSAATRRRRHEDRGGRGHAPLPPGDDGARAPSRRRGLPSSPVVARPPRVAGPRGRRARCA